MTNDELNLVDSVLSVKASGTELENSIQKDLESPQGKSIAELIYDQEKNNEENK